MADTKLAVRRLPFDLGTKMLFAQATVPPQWTLDVTDNDRFLRVVSGAGGGIGGPDNVGVDNTDIDHTHTFNHTHSSSHIHPMDHGHGFSLGRTNGMSTVATENSANYRIRDDASGWVSRVSGSRHIRVDAGSNDEGEHDHAITGYGTASVNTGGMSPTSTTGGASAGSTGTSTTSLSHSHDIDANFRPSYKDVIVGELTG